MKKVFHILNIFMITFILIFILFCVGCKKENHGEHSQNNDHSSHEDHKDHEDHKAHEDHKEDEDHKAHDDHTDHEVKNFGKNMAVLKADENKGIQLSKESIKTIGLVEKGFSQYSLKKKNTYRIPISSLIFYENKVGIYLKMEKWYSFHEIRIVQRSNKNAHIILTGKYDKAMLIIKGCSLLRLAHLEAFGASGHGHGH